jgi:hypothetical protein
MSSVTHTFYEGHDLVVRCDLKGSKADLASIQGTAEFSMGHGGVHPGPFMNAIASVLGPSLSQLTYDSVRARALFEKGIVRVENGELNGSLTILFHGTYVVAANGLDFLLNIKLPKKSSSSFIGWKYSMPVDVIIGGTLSHPTCHLKTSQMIGSALNKVKQHIGGAVNNILKNSIGQILNSR